MKGLHYLKFDEAFELYDAGGHIPDGVVIAAPCALIEKRGEDERLRQIEEHAGNSDWKLTHRDGTYHYTLLVARQGVTELKDANGDTCGFSVAGTDRRSDVPYAQSSTESRMANLHAASEENCKGA